MQSDKTSLGVNIRKGVFWKLFEGGSVQIIYFGMTIILARLLQPADFGVVGLVTVFVAISGVFVNGGFSSALVQKDELDEEHYFSVLVFSLVVSVILCVCLFVFAPVISEFYGIVELTEVVRLLSVTLVFNAVYGVYVARETRAMKFNRIFVANTAGTLLSGIVGVMLAYCGLGVFSLVWLQIVYSIVSTLLLCVCTRWIPKPKLSLDKLRILLAFGYKMFLSSFISTIFTNCYPLIIGKSFGAVPLGMYNRAQSIPSLIINNVNGAISSVMFPAFSLCQKNKHELRSLLRKVISITTFVIFPMMFFVVAIAEPLVKVLLTDKWVPCVPLLKLTCIGFAFWPFHTANLQAISAFGRSDIFLKLEIIKRILLVVFLVVTVQMGLYAMVFGIAILSVLSAIINVSPNKKLLGYGFLEQLRDVLPSLFMSILAWWLVDIFISIFENSVSKLFFGGVGFFVIYFTLAWWFKIESMSYLWLHLKNYVAKIRR